MTATNIRALKQDLHSPFYLYMTSANMFTIDLYNEDCIIYHAGCTTDNFNNKHLCIKKWYSGNTLVLNVGKCNSWENVTLYRLVHHTYIQKVVSHLKFLLTMKKLTMQHYLGVWLEQTLIWKEQALYKLCHKLSQRFGMLSRMQKSSPLNILIVYI